MLLGARQFFAAKKAAPVYDDSLALVNNGGVFFDTGITIGGTVSAIVEAIVLHRATDNTTGQAFVGHNGTNDSNDFRFFISGSAWYGDCGTGRSMMSSSNDVWHKIKWPTWTEQGGILSIDGTLSHTIAARTDMSQVGFGAVGKNLCLFAASSSAASQQGCIRRVTITDYTSNAVIADFLPHASGRLVDTQTGNIITASVGTPVISKWADISTEEGWTA